jgi:hypothetical protein
MKITYYLNEGRKKNLYCRISDGAERVTFSLEHTVDPKKWNVRKEEVKDEDPYYFTLMGFKSYLTKKYHELNSEGSTTILTQLKNEALQFLDGSGIEGIARKMFDHFNEKGKLPKYDEYIRAFEQYSNLKRGQYSAEAVGTVIHFHTDDEEYVVDTYEGRIALLKSFVENRSYDEIYVMTEENFWSEIYIDGGIEKHVFLPQLLTEWENYWDKTYKDIKVSIGTTDHLDEMKERSWRRFQVYMECYDGHGDSIKLASEIDEDGLYPMAVIAMLAIFDADTCYQEYCELEFYGEGGWESISLDEEKEDSAIFFIKPNEI